MVYGNDGKNNFFGSGCLIGPRMVLTAAHNCYDRASKKESKDMEFIPEIMGI